LQGLQPMDDIALAQSLQFNRTNISGVDQSSDLSGMFEHDQEGDIRQSCALPANPFGYGQDESSLNNSAIKNDKLKEPVADKAKLLCDVHGEAYILLCLKD